MGKRGPKRTPTATLRLRGSRLAKDRQDDLKVPPGLPSMPRWLPEAGKLEWKRIARPLFERGVLTHLDRTVLALYCCAVSDFLECKAIIECEGHVLRSDKGNAYVHPASGMMANAWSRILKSGAELGLSPSSRPGIYASAPPKPDALDAFLARKGGKASVRDKWRRP